MSGIIDAIFGGGSGGGGSAFHPYSPTGLGTADPAWQNMLGALIANSVGPGTATSQVAGQLSPAYLQELATISGPYGQAQQVAANQAGQYYGNMASQADAFHNLMSAAGTGDYGRAGALTGAGTDIWKTAQDPQNALRDRLQQQVTDASRFSTSARGIGMAPEAAGIENQDVSRFLQDWENQKLQREVSGLGAMTGAFRGAGQEAQAGSGQLTGSQAMSALAPQLLQQSASVPYQAQMFVPQSIMGASDQYIRSQQQDQWAPFEQIMNQIIPYLNYGTGAQANAFAAGNANLSNLFTGGGLLTNDYGQGKGGFSNSPLGYLTGLFGNPFGGATGATGAMLGSDFAAGGGGGLSGLSLADILPFG